MVHAHAHTHVQLISVQILWQTSQLLIHPSIPLLIMYIKCECAQFVFLFVCLFLSSKTVMIAIFYEDVKCTVRSQ